MIKVSIQYSGETGSYIIINWFTIPEIANAFYLKILKNTDEDFIGAWIEVE